MIRDKLIHISRGLRLQRHQDGRVLDLFFAKKSGRVIVISDRPGSIPLTFTFDTINDFECFTQRFIKEARDCADES